MKTLRLMLLVALLIALVLVADLSIQLGVAGGVPYVAPVIVSLWLPRRRFTIYVAIITTALTILGLFLSPSGGEMWKVLLNRSYALFAIWVVALIGLQRKRAEEEVRLQSAALESAANGIVITDTEGTIIWVNQAFTALTGYTAEEAIGQNPRLVKSGKHDLTFYKDLWTTITSGRVWHGEVINRRKDGRYYTEEETITPVRNESGEITNFIAIKQDITERKQTEETLEESDRQSRAILESMSQGIVIIDSNRRIVLVNSMIKDMFGYHQDELLGRSLETLLPQRLRDIHAGHFATYVLDPVLRSMGPEIECIGSRKDGSEFPVEVALSHIQTRESVLVMALVMDITERKEAEQQILRANKELESFSYSVSHDLRAPLRAIDGFSRILIDEYGPQLLPEAKRYLQIVIDSVAKMSSLIDNLLAFSRLTRQPMKKRLFAPDKLAREAFEELKAETQDRQIEFRLGDFPDCQGDPALLKQVYLNLIENALKYTRKRDPAVIEGSAAI